MMTTTYQWATPLSLGLVLALGLGAAAAFGLLRWLSGRPIGLARRPALWALRGSILAALVVILLNPVRVEETPGRVERPRVAYLLDASESMALGPAGGTRWDRAVGTLRGAEAATEGPAAPRVDPYQFGGRLAALEALPGTPAPAGGSAPIPADPRTLLAGSLGALAERFGPTPPRAVVVFSDGRAQDADRAPAVARGYKAMGVPIHVVPVGQAGAGGDVAIVSMVVPNLVRKSSRIPVRLFVRSYGYKGQRAEARLVALQPDGTPGATLGRAPITLRDGLADYALSFESGEQDRRIAAMVATQPDEVSAANNTLAADVAIDHTKIRVLYVEGTNERIVARAGMFGLGGGEIQGAYSTLRKALLEDVDVECTVVVPSGRVAEAGAFVRVDDSSRGLPETLSELFAYDAIILSNVPSSTLTPRYMGWIEEWVGRRGGGLCMVGGPDSFGSGRWADTPIGRILPVEVESAGADWVDGAAALRPVAGAGSHPLWHILADDAANRDLLNALPAQVGHNRLGPSKPSAEVLARFGPGGGGDASEPALAVQPFGRGRTMALATGVTRRFGPEFVQSWGVGDNRYFAKFWRNAVYWLTENSSIGRRRLLAETEKRLYRPGEPITLTARAFDENATPTLNYRVAVSVEPRAATDAAAATDNSPLRKPAAGPDSADDRGPLLPWGEEFDLGKLAADQAYIARLPIASGADLPTGSATQGLRIELTAYEGNTQVDSTSLDVQILDDPPEQQNPLPDHDLLGQLARASGGSVLPDSKALAAMLAKLPVAAGPPEVRVMPAWSRPWLLATLIALLTVEWAWRRRLGLA